MICGRHMRTPGLVEDLIAHRQGGDHVAGDARLIFALMCQECAMSHVTDRIQPFEPRQSHRVVGGQPTAWSQSDCLETDIERARLAPGRDQNLVDNNRGAFTDIQPHALGRALNSGDIRIQ